MTIADLRACESGSIQHISAAAAIKRKLSALNLSHVRALFATRKLVFSTSLIMAVWAFIGLAYPLYNAFLPFLLALRGVQYGDGSTSLTYRNTLIVAAVGIPGALLGGVLVELPKLGRKGTLGLSTVLTGVFLYCSTTAKTSNALLGWNCAFNFCSNVMYAVLYAYTPEIFPTKDRGTGNALTATANRIFGIMAVSSDPPYTIGLRLTKDVANHCYVCKSEDLDTRLCQWRFVRRCWMSGRVVAIRTARKGESVIVELSEAKIVDNTDSLQHLETWTRVPRIHRRCQSSAPELTRNSNFRIYVSSRATTPQPS